METILTNSTNNTIEWEANPSFYDYIHRLTLNFNTNKFTMVDGGGQVINAIYKGFFKVCDNHIIFNYQKHVDPYDDSYKTDDEDDNDSSTQTYPTNDVQILGTQPFVNGFRYMNRTKSIGFKIVEEPVDHFNGYCKYTSKWTMILDESPFKLESLVDSRRSNLFNNLSDNSYPLTFYSCLENVPCDVLYERSVRDEKYYKKDFVEQVDSSRNDVMEENSELIRKLNSSEPYRYWQIIKMDPINREVIVCGTWKSQPIFVVRNKDSVKYWVPDPNQNYKYVETTDDQVIMEYSPLGQHPDAHVFNSLV